MPIGVRFRKRIAPAPVWLPTECGAISAVSGRVDLLYARQHDVIVNGLSGGKLGYGYRVKGWPGRFAVGRHPGLRGALQKSGRSTCILVVPPGRGAAARGRAPSPR